MINSLRRIALDLPGTEEGMACAGTPLESRTIKVGGKAFLFLRATELRLKLGASLPQAKKLAAKEPDRCDAGAGGWVKLVLRPGETKPPSFLAGWIVESHGLYAKAGGAPASKKVKAKTKATKPRRGG
jgi:hypothetical protein